MSALPDAWVMHKSRENSLFLCNTKIFRAAQNFHSTMGYAVSLKI